MAGAALEVPLHDLYFPIKTNPHLFVFTTELIATEYAMVWTLQNKTPMAFILTDCLSAVQALQSGQSKTRPDKINMILSLIEKVMAQTSQYEKSNGIPSHVGISGNEAADATAKLGMNFGTTDEILLSKAEVYPTTNNVIMSKRQDLWDLNTKNTGETTHHVFFECNMNAGARRNLETTMRGLGYKTV